MKIDKLLFPLFIVIAIVFIYRIILLPFSISGGDYTSVTPSQLFIWRHMSFFLWNSNLNLGWGIIPFLASSPYIFIIGWIGKLLGENGAIAERIAWWIPVIVVGFILPWILFKKIFGSFHTSILAPFIYLCNTYILLIITGGQIAGIGQAYVLAPLIVLSYIKLFEKPTFKMAVVTGIALAVSIMFDLRMTYILLVGVGVYLFIKLIDELRSTNYRLGKTVKKFGLALVVPGVISALLQAYWLLPMAIVRQNPLAQLGNAYDTAGAVRFFSFAKFEDAFGLLHPNWPENIFGLTHFMRPEFLVLPLLAYGALLFTNWRVTSDELRIKEKKRIGELRSKNRIGELRIADDELDNSQYTIHNTKIYVIYFALLGLIGAFLAKGANDPLGGIYIWMFHHVPGFIMFRDPTKWYLLIALSYSMLIPYTVGRIYFLLKDKFAN